LLDIFIHFWVNERENNLREDGGINNVFKENSVKKM